MNIDSHKRTLAILHIVVGILSLLMAGAAIVSLSIFLPFLENLAIQEEGPEIALIFDFIGSAVFSIIIIVTFLTSLPSIIGGFATLKEKEYGIVLLLISGCISLLSFPLGTALGTYTIWVFVENNKTKQNAELDG